jgi:prepilin-type N-terminal cleavage/methylation domain-containing protein
MRAAFTLIEIMLVMAILALLAMASALKLGHSLQAAAMRDVCQQIQSLDAHIRHQAIRSGQGLQLTFTLGGRDLVWQDQITHKLVLPAGYTLQRLKTGTTDQTTGSVSIICSSLGYMPTYAVQVKGPTRSRWLASAGLSGQVREIANDQEIQAIFARHDAD